MSRKIIAVIKLAPGQVGYYDEVSGVYLTTVNSSCNVYQGMNTTRLQQAVKQKKLILVSGSLVPIQPFSLEPECVVETKARTVGAKAVNAKAAVKTEVVETIETEPVEEKVAKKKSAKKVADKVEAAESETEVRGE